MPVNPNFETETNAAAIVTSAAGVGSFTSTKLRDLVDASVEVAGYVAVVTSVSGQVITFQLYQTGSAVSTPLLAPTSAVTIAIGDAHFKEWGF